MRTVEIAPASGRPRTPLIGREQELAIFSALLCRADCRLVTLTGPAGSGKTRLAIELAARLEDAFDGVAFVDLTPLRDPTLVIPAIAQTLGIRTTGGQPLLPQLVHELRGRRLLLVLDNFEQILAAGQELAALLAGCPALIALATSREPLHLRSEQQFPVSPLALPDLARLPDVPQLAAVPAVALFLDRARAVRPDFDLATDDAATVAEICVRLEGLPLALELAAARIKLFPPRALLTRLERQLDILTGGAHDLPARQQTLRRAIGWSYELLDDGEQRLFRRLAVFLGGCTLDAVRAVCAGGSEQEVVDGVASLIDKNLLQQVKGPGEEPRVRMLEMIHAYAAERLLESGELEQMRRHHAIWATSFVEEAARYLTTAAGPAWIDRLEADIDNIRAAVRWMTERGEADMGGRLIWSLYYLFIRGMHFQEAEQWAAALSAVPDAAGRTPTRARLLAIAGALAGWRGDYQAGPAWLAESVAIWRESADRSGLADTLTLLGRVLLDVNLQAATPLLEESLALYRQLGDPWRLARSLTFVGDVALREGDDARAQRLLDESLALFRHTGEPWAIGMPLAVLGQLAERRGDNPTARAWYEESIRRFRATGPHVYVQTALTGLALLLYRQGDERGSAALFAESLALTRREGAGQRVRGQVGVALATLAALASRHGDLERAARLLGAAGAFRQAQTLPPPGKHEAGYQHALALVQEQLGQDRFAAAWTRGQMMALEDVLDEAQAAAGTIARQAPPTRGRDARTASTPTRITTLPDGLSPREAEVLRLLAGGRTNKEIAAALVLSVRTVESHRANLYAKTGARTRAQLLAYALRHGLAALPDA